MSTLVRLFVFGSAATVATSCAAPGVDDDGVDDPNIAAQSEAIISGFQATTSSFTSNADRRSWSTVRIYNRAYQAHACGGSMKLGTGVLLENNVVLTAAHVVAQPADCDTPSPPYAPAPTSAIYVYSADLTTAGVRPTTCNAGACSKPIESGIVINPNNTDTALIFLASPLKGIGGYTFGHFVPMFPFDEQLYVGDSVWCTGYGINVCSPPSGAEVLRFGRANVSTGVNPDQQLFLDDFDGEIPEAGDSGGPCWAGYTNPWPVLSINSGSNYCVFHDIPGANDSSWAVSPSSFRNFALTEIAARKPTVTFAFGSSTDVAWWSGYNPPNTTTNWTVANGVYSEPNNVGGTTEPDGPLRFSALEIHDNADVSVKVYSSTNDNDGAGIVFRYVDSNNFYLFYVCVENQIARFYKREAGVYTAIGTGTFPSITWSATTAVTLKVTLREANFKGFVNGAQVATAADSEFPKGHVGLQKFYLQNAKFDDFTVTPKAPSSTADWPLPP